MPCNFNMCSANAYISFNLKLLALIIDGGKNTLGKNISNKKN